MALLYHLLVHGILLGCLFVFVLLCCFMSCLLWFLLFDVFYVLYSAAVSVLSDVVLFVDTRMVLYADLYHDTFTSQHECFTTFFPSLPYAKSSPL